MSDKKELNLIEDFKRYYFTIGYHEDYLINTYFYQVF